MTDQHWAEQIKWNTDGLIAVIAQEAQTHTVLMLAWMNQDALTETLNTGYATYWSRSRNRLWRKGESSGHQQKVSDIRLDCDGDALLLTVEQIGGIACHTGRKSCFYKQYQVGVWQSIEPILKTTQQIYG